MTDSTPQHTPGEIELSDDDLRRARMEPIRAWKRAAPSAGAQRKARNRQRRRADGIAQINIEAPSDERTRTAIYGLAAALRVGALPITELEQLIKISANGNAEPANPGPASGDRHPDRPDRSDDLCRRVRRVINAGGLRARAILWLIR